MRGCHRDKKHTRKCQVCFLQEETDPVELRRLSLWIILDHSPVAFRRLPHGSDLLWNRSDVFRCLQDAEFAGWCSVQLLLLLVFECVEWCSSTMHWHYFPSAFSASRNLYFLCFCHTSWRRCRKAWNQASSATLGNFIKTECLFCPWILCLAAATHLCWESCSEKPEFCLPELTTPNSNNFPCWGHSQSWSTSTDKNSSVMLNLLVFVCS